MLKNKAVSVINLLGLTLGIVISVLLLSYVRQEKDTDKFIKDYENIYMLSQSDDITSSHISRPAMTLLRDRFPEIHITHTSDDLAGQVFLSDDMGNSFKVKHLLNTDSAFFNVFQFDAVAGDPQHALDVTSQIVLKRVWPRKFLEIKIPSGKRYALAHPFTAMSRWK